MEKECVFGVRIEERVVSLEKWQKAQNGSILRLESKVDKLQFWIMTSAASAIITLAVLIANLLK